jgi:hypothetical protein
MNTCSVLARGTGRECGQPAAAVASHNSRPLTFHVCAKHAPDYETKTWTVTYIATRLAGYTHAFSGVCGAGFRGGAR